MQASALATARVLVCQPQLDRLRRVAAFARLSQGDLSLIARASTVRRYVAGAIVVAQGERLSGLYIVCQGHAKICLFGDTGRELVLGALAEADTYGEISLLDDSVTTTSLVAQDDLVTIIVERSALLSVLRRDATMGLALLQNVVAHTQRTERLVAGLGLHDVAARVEQTLLRLGDSDGEPCAEGILIHARPTQQDLANMVGTCRETVSRTLSALSKQGFVVARGRSLLLRRAFVERARRAAA